MNKLEDKIAWQRSLVLMSPGQLLTTTDNKGNFGQEFRDPKIAQCFALAETAKMLN